MKLTNTPKESPQISAVQAPKPRRRFDDAFRRRAVGLVQSGRTVREVGKELGVSLYSLYEWQRKFRRQVDIRASIPKTMDGLQVEIERLREASNRLQLREEILKKACNNQYT